MLDTSRHKWGKKKNEKFEALKSMELTARGNVEFALKAAGYRGKECREIADEHLSLVRLTKFKDAYPHELSGGMKQRVAIARALSYRPKVLLMDEPLSALDKKLREELQTELRRIHQQTGVTILYVTHDQEEALRLSDRIAVFNKGRIEQVGSGEELYAKPASRFVASFIGNSNFLPVTLAASNGATLKLIIESGELADLAVIADASQLGLDEGVDFLKTSTGK